MNRDIDLFDIFAGGILLAMIVILIAGAIREPRRIVQRCHRFYSAAATARDSLWIQVLRPECRVTP